MATADSGTPVSILGEELRLRGASPERINALAAYVDEMFRQHESVKDMRRQAILVSLHIAEEMFEEREQIAARLRELEVRVRAGHGLLDSALDAV